MSVLRQASGAQILPPADDRRATISAYHAHCALDADQRRKHPAYAAIVAGLYPAGSVKGSAKLPENSASSADYSPNEQES